MVRNYSTSFVLASKEKVPEQIESSILSIGERGSTAFKQFVEEQTVNRDA